MGHAGGGDWDVYIRSGMYRLIVVSMQPWTLPRIHAPMRPCTYMSMQGQEACYKHGLLTVLLRWMKSFFPPQVTTLLYWKFTPHSAKGSSRPTHPRYIFVET